MVPPADFCKDRDLSDDRINQLKLSMQNKGFDNFLLATTILGMDVGLKKWERFDSKHLSPEDSMPYQIMVLGGNHTFHAVKGMQNNKAAKSLPGIQR